MSDLNIDPTNAVAAQDPTEAQADYNTLRQFARFWALTIDDPDDIENESVVVSTLFQRWIQNVRPIAVSSDTKIRVVYSADRPPSMILDGHLVQNTSNTTSDAYVGGAGTIYGIAIRNGKRFTLEIRDSSVEGEDERVVCEMEWDGSAIIDGSIVSYEAEGIGGVQELDPEVIKAWCSVLLAGSIGDSHQVSSVSKGATGIYTINLSRSFLNNNYAVVGCAYNATAGFNVSVRSKTANQCVIGVYNLAGSLSDQNFDVWFIGDV
jgi:hypothetical protein